MTLSANTPRAYELGNRSEFPVVGGVRIFEGSVVALRLGDGAAGSFNTSSIFGGFAIREANNTSGSTSDINVEVISSGTIQVPVTGVVPSDVGQPVYASADDTFTHSPDGNMFVGFVKRVPTSGTAVIDFDLEAYKNPYGEYSVIDTITSNQTLDIEDNGKLFWVITDGVVITLPAVATPVNCRIVNGGSTGMIGINVSPNVNDRIQGPNRPGTDDKDLINTKATALRGDFIELVAGDTNGPIVSKLRGTWNTEA